MTVPPGQVHAVFVHGAGGGGWEWIVWQRVFAAHGIVSLAPDLRPATRGLTATQLDDYAAQVVQWCAASSGPHVLIGASLGGLLVLLAAPRVDPVAVILVNPLPPAGIGVRSPLRAYRDIVPWGRDRSLRGTQQALPDGDDAARLFAFRRWRDESGAVLNVAQAGVAVATPRCPMLVLASELDEDCAASTSARLSVRLGAQLRLLPGASHLGPLLGRNAASIADEAAQWLSTTRPCNHALRSGGLVVRYPLG